MAHELDFTKGRAAIAYDPRNGSPWHHFGAAMQPGMTRDQWIAAAGLDYTVSKSPGYYYVGAELRRADDLAFLTRDDNGAVLGRSSVTDGYQMVQPREPVDFFFDQYIAQDDRFAMDVAGALRGGTMVWATATFKEPVIVAGDGHVMRLLMTTTYDATQATRVQGVTERVVCRNTWRMAMSEQAPVVSVRHNAKFDAAAVAKQLAGIVQGFAKYKIMGDAMASVTMGEIEVNALFRAVLDIPADAKKVDISTRKFNQFGSLARSLNVTRRERSKEKGAPIELWEAWQAITRYVDHERISVNGDGGEKQFLTANFGSGDQMKNKALGLIMPRIKDLIAA